MKRSVPMLSFLLLAAACSRPTPAPENVVAVGNAVAAIERLPRGEQEAVLFRAVRDAGLPCQQLTDVARQPDEHGRPLWRVRCDDGQFHLVEIGANGMATVTSRTDAPTE